MNVLFDETVFIFPFSYKGGLRKWNKHFEKEKLDTYWSLSRDIDSKYYLKHIFNEENKPLHYEYVEGSMKWNYQDEVLVQTTLTNHGGEEKYRFTLAGFSLFVYPTGLGFLTLRIRYPENETTRNIANLSAAFSRILANERGLVNSKIVCSIGEERYSMMHLLKDCVGENVGNQLEFFPCTNGKRAFVFQRLQREKLTEAEKTALRRNLWLNEEAEEDISGLTDLEKELVLDGERTCMLSPMVMCVITHKIRGTEREQRRRQNNVRFSYFNLFLMCIHEQQALLLYNQEEVAIGKNFGASRKVKEELLRFLPTYSFKVVSMEIVYQQIFLSLQEILHLEELEENLKEDISMLEAAYTEKRERRLNLILAVISIMGVVSLISDIVTLYTQFFGC